MTEFTDAARTLRALLQAENTALRQGPATMTILMPDKEAAATALTQAAATAPRTYYNQALAEQIQELAAENAALLLTAIAVQSRVIAVVTRAARASASATERPGTDRARYNQHGAGADQASPAMALMHRA